MVLVHVVFSRANNASRVLLLANAVPSFPVWQIWITDQIPHSCASESSGTRGKQFRCLLLNLHAKSAILHVCLHGLYSHSLQIWLANATHCNLANTEPVLGQCVTQTCGNNGFIIKLADLHSVYHTQNKVVTSQGLLFISRLES